MENFNLTCPIPINEYPHILLAHGGGGKLMQQLIEKMFVGAFSEPNQVLHDAATLPITTGKIAMTTDSYVVNPLFFPGGDIGSLAINGTVNDLAMAGAKPLYLTLGFILEEGLPMETLWRVVQSLQKNAQIAGVKIVTGDTKVVDKGKGDGIFINTSGVGIVEHDQVISPASVIPGDVVLLSGDLGRHGIAIMALREGLEFESTIESDCAPLAETVLNLLNNNIEIHCLRDLTRGGLASALNEIASAAKVNINISEKLIPINENVQGACEILGFDPLYVANEGRFIAIVPPSFATKALEIMGENACQIGVVKDHNSGLVTMESAIGATRIIDLLTGQQLPRIC